MRYYQKRNNITFINPYTFVPVEKDRPIDRQCLESLPSAGLHTGILKCRLYVRTPLAIPDADKVKEDAQEHKEYPFFTYKENGKDIPAIPGSSLRGVIRSVFETVTDSCFSTLRENTGLSRRIGSKEAYKPGILKWQRGNWHLYRAERYLLAVDPKLFGESDYAKYEGLPKDTYVGIIQKGKTRIAKTLMKEELRFGDLVDFQPYTAGKGTYKKGKYLIWNGVARNVTIKKTGSASTAGKIEGLVYIGENFAGKKHGESIFVCKTPENGLRGEQLSKAYNGLLETLAIYQNPAINRSKGHSGYIDFGRAKKETGIPVWYSVENKKLSLAAIGRTFYNTSLNDLTKDRNPCTKREALCEACILFGMAKDESLGSRIRITDARAKNREQTKKKTETLKILGQPVVPICLFMPNPAPVPVQEFPVPMMIT